MDPAVIGSQLFEGAVQQLPLIGAVVIALIGAVVILAFVWRLIILLLKVGAFVGLAAVLLHFSSGYLSQVREQLVPENTWATIENITSAVRNELSTVDVNFEVRRVRR